MQRSSRRSTPRVVDGRVQRKNHRDLPRRDDGAPLAIEVRVPGAGYRHVLDEAMLRRFLALIPDWPRVSRGLQLIILDEGSDERDGWYANGVIGVHAWPDPPATIAGAAHFAAHEQVWRRLGAATRPAPEFVGAVAYDDEAAALKRVERLLERRFDGFDWKFEPGAAAGEWLVRDLCEPPARPVVCDLARVGDELHLYHRAVHLRVDRRQAAAYLLLHVLLHELGHHVDALAPPRRGSRGEDYAEGWALRCADAIWDVYMREFAPRR